MDTPLLINLPWMLMLLYNVHSFTTTLGLHRILSKFRLLCPRRSVCDCENSIRDDGSALKVQPYYSDATMEV